MALNAMTTEIAKAIHRTVKQPEQAKEMIEQLFDTQATRLRESPSQMRQPLPPLPPLPEGVELPQALLPRILSNLPSALMLDTFEAEDWARLEQVEHLLTQVMQAIGRIHHHTSHTVKAG